MAVKIKYRNPKTTDFSKEDLVINTKTGDLFYKSEQGLHKLSEESGIIPPSYHLASFHFAGLGSTVHEFISWANPGENDQMNYTHQLLMPFDGTIHKMFWKQTATTNNLIIKIYKNPLCQGKTLSNSTQISNTVVETFTVTPNVGSIDACGEKMGDMNTLDINVDVESGDHINISMKGVTITDLEDVTGQLLYSQNITI